MTPDQTALLDYGMLAEPEVPDRVEVAPIMGLGRRPAMLEEAKNFNTKTKSGMQRASAVLSIISVFTRGVAC